MCNERKGKAMERVKRAGWPGIRGWARVRVARRQENLGSGGINTLIRQYSRHMLQYHFLEIIFRTE